MEISKAKSCDLEKAVKSISLNYTVSCEYDDITKISTTLRNVGISLLTLNLLCFLLTLLFMLLHPKLKLVCISVSWFCIRLCIYYVSSFLLIIHILNYIFNSYEFLYFQFPLIGIFSVFMIIKYNDILNSKTSEKDMVCNDLYYVTQLICAFTELCDGNMFKSKLILTQPVLSWDLELSLIES